MPQITDRFDLKGEHGGRAVHVVYTSHWRMPPAPGQIDNDVLVADSLEVGFGDLDLSADKYEFDVTDTGVGTLVSRRLWSVPDKETTTLAVLVPHVAHGATTDRGAVRAEGVLTRVDTPQAPPAAQGAIEHYEHVTLSGVLARQQVPVDAS